MSEPADPLDSLLSATVKEACRITGFSKDALYILIGDGSIESFLMGSRRFVVIPSLRAYIARRAAEPLQHGRAPIKRQRHGRRVEEGFAGPQKPSKRSTG